MKGMKGREGRQRKRYGKNGGKSRAISIGWVHPSLLILLDADEEKYHGNFENQGEFLNGMSLYVINRL